MAASPSLPAARASRLWAAFALAAALLFGQQALALHDLGHAKERLAGTHKGVPVETSCDQCAAFAQLAGAVGSTPVVLPALVPAPLPIVGLLPAGTPARPERRFLSRAPPASPL